MLTALAPCHDCHQQKPCAELLLACEAYAVYHRGDGRRHWSQAPRNPQSSIYAALFASLDDRETESSDVALGLR
jgi:hypothetical protein